MTNKDGEGLMGLFLRLRKFGIDDELLLKAIESVPHNQFLHPDHQANAWRNESFPLPCGQMLWSVDILARILSAAQLKQGDTVLEIGCGSGYLTALASQLCRKVRSLERYSKLADQARIRLANLGIRNVVLDHCDGYSGTPGEGLYDCIICDSCYDVIPEFLSDQLVSGGVIITALGDSGSEQMLVKFSSVGSRLEREDLFPVRFTPIERGVSKIF